MKKTISIKGKFSILYIIINIKEATRRIPNNTASDLFLTGTKSFTSAEPEKEIEVEQIPLTKLSGLGPATAKKFKDVGVNSVEQLCEEVPEELAHLIPGCSEERITKWVEEGKELINK